jgi:5-methylcytosine-specific restriction endonuclease McrA
MARNASKRRRDARVRQRRPGRAPNCQRDRDAWGSYHPLAIFDRDGWRCRYCACEVSRDVPPQAPNRASIDHVVPLNGETVSGLDVIFNVVTACRACNSAKSNRLDFKKEAS